MNANIVLEAARASLSGSLPFPKIVEKLINTGVEYYHVDYIALQMTFYSAEGGVVTTPIVFEALPVVAKDFDAKELRAAIYDSQHQGQKFREFSERAMKSGVQGYFAFLHGQRVTYFGRQGDQHIEWFPGTESKKI